MTKPHLWLRAESRSHEMRAPLIPEHAEVLVKKGFTISVEESPNRIFPTQDYRDVGCTIVPHDSWQDAPKDAFVFGLKELADDSFPLKHRHILFAHAYKGQEGAERLLKRFGQGGGTLYDLEYLVDDKGRIASFGYWAGFMGAALGILHTGEKLGPQTPTSLKALQAKLAQAPKTTKALVIGAKGRCGKGAIEALAIAGITPTCWDMEETNPIDHKALLDHDMLINAVGMAKKAPPFLTPAIMASHPDRKLRLIVDVTCDVGNDANALPIYTSLTSWEKPFSAHAFQDDSLAYEVIAIDNLPSLLPRESSTSFSDQLLPYVLTLDEGPVWQEAKRTFATFLPTV